MNRRVLIAVIALIAVLAALGLRGAAVPLQLATTPPKRPLDLPPPALAPQGDVGTAGPQTADQVVRLRKAAYLSFYRPANYAPADECRMGQKSNVLRIRFGYDDSGNVDPQCFDVADAHCVCVADEIRAAGLANRDLAGQHIDLDIPLTPWKSADEIALRVRRIFGIKPNDIGAL